MERPPYAPPSFEVFIKYLTNNNAIVKLINFNMTGTFSNRVVFFKS